MARALFNKVMHENIKLTSKLTNSNIYKDRRQRLGFELIDRSFPLMIMAIRTYFMLKCSAIYFLGIAVSNSI